MFISITDDRNHIDNEWTCDKKLSAVDVRSNKWHETNKNAHFSSFRQLVGLVVGRWFIFFFAHGARVGRQKKKKKKIRSEAEKKLFHIDFDESVGKPETRLFLLGHRIALPCCGYSLESHWRSVFNEYPQRILWRNKQNDPLIITKYPSYLFHFLCAQRRLRSAWASAQSDQSLRCPLNEQLRSQGFFMRTAKTLIRRGGCPAWFESSLGAQVILLVLSCCGSFSYFGIH